MTLDMAEALSDEPGVTLFASELHDLQIDELMDLLRHREVFLDERELEKDAADAGQMANYAIGKVLRAGKGLGNVGPRAAVGAAAGAVGGAAASGDAKGAVKGAVGGAVAGAVAKPAAKAILKMKGPVGEYARKSVQKSYLGDFVKAVKKPFAKTAGPMMGMAQKALGQGMRLAVTTPGATRAAVGAGVGAAGGAMAAQPGNRMGGALGGAAAGALAGYAAKPMALRVGGMANRVGRAAGGAMKATARGMGAAGAPVMGPANAVQVQRISQMAGRRVQRQGTGMMSRLSMPAATPTSNMRMG